MAQNWISILVIIVAISCGFLICFRNYITEDVELRIKLHNYTNVIVYLNLILAFANYLFW